MKLERGDGKPRGDSQRGIFGSDRARLDLQALGDRFQSKPFGNTAGIPLQEGGVDFVDPVVLNVEHLSLFHRLATVGEVEFVVLADVDFPDQGALGEDWKGAVNRGAGDRAVNFAGRIKQLFSGEMVWVPVGGPEDGKALLGHAEAAIDEKLAEPFFGSLGR